MGSEKIVLILKSKNFQIQIIFTNLLISESVFVNKNLKKIKGFKKDKILTRNSG